VGTPRPTAFVPVAEDPMVARRAQASSTDGAAMSQASREAVESIATRDANEPSVTDTSGPRATDTAPADSGAVAATVNSVFVEADTRQGEGGKAFVGTPRPTAFVPVGEDAMVARRAQASSADGAATSEATVQSKNGGTWAISRDQSMSSTVREVEQLCSMEEDAKPVTVSEIDSYWHVASTEVGLEQEEERRKRGDSDGQEHRTSSCHSCVLPLTWRLWRLGAWCPFA